MGCAGHVPRSRSAGLAATGRGLAGKEAPPEGPSGRRVDALPGGPHGAIPPNVPADTCWASPRARRQSKAPSRHESLKGGGARPRPDRRACMPGQAVATGLLPVPAPCRGVARQPGRGKGEGAPPPIPPGSPSRPARRSGRGLGRGASPPPHSRRMAAQAMGARGQALDGPLAARVARPTQGAVQALSLAAVALPVTGRAAGAVPPKFKSAQRGKNGSDCGKPAEPVRRRSERACLPPHKCLASAHQGARF